MAGLINDNFKEEIMTELSWMMTALVDISSKYKIETYELTLIKYRVQPEEEQIINKFVTLNNRTIQTFAIQEIQKWMSNEFQVTFQKDWIMSDQLVQKLKDLIRAVRNARAEVNVAPSKAITIMIKTSDKELEDFFTANTNYINRFTNPEKLVISSDMEAPELAMTSIITGAEIYLPLADLLNVEEELARLDKELAKWQKELDMVGKKLGNKRFVANAKPEVVQKERDKQADYQAKFDATKDRIVEMQKLSN